MQINTPEEETRLWGRIVKGTRILKSETVPCDPQDIDEALLALCRRFDVPRPLWLQKNEKDFASFGRTHFSQDHFMEPISFSRMEIELISPEAKKRHVRNPLMEA